MRRILGAQIVTVIAAGFLAGQPLQAQQSKTVSITLDTSWTGTGLTVSPGEDITVMATGIMNWFTGSCDGKCTSTPDGLPWTDCKAYGGFADPGLACWSLVGKIGSNGKPFQVGSSYQGTVPPSVSGELYLGVNDNYYPDNTGNWTAVITISTAPQAGALTFTNPYATLIASQSALGPVSESDAVNSVTASAISADGVSAAVVVYTSSSNQQVTFSSNVSSLLFTKFDPGYLTPNFTPSGAMPTLMNVPPIPMGDSYVALALAWPPAQLPLAAVGKSIPQVSAVVTATQGSATATGDLYILPPPVLLVHGIWSSPKEAGFSPDSNPTGFFNFLSMNYPAAIDWVDYSRFNYLAFSDSSVQGAFLQGLVGLINEVNAQPSGSTVARTVDVVAHSMGGLITRWYILNSLSSGVPKGAPFLLPNPVNQLITIGTPHLGSNMASTLFADQDYVIELSPSHDTMIEEVCIALKAADQNVCSLKSLLAAMGRKVYTGVQSLMGPGDNGPSWQLQQLENAAAPPPSKTFDAILGQAPTSSCTGSWLNFLINSFAPPNSVNNILGPENDTIVAINSQEDAPAGQSLAQANSLVNGVVHSALSMCGSDVGETASPNVWNQVLSWLVAPPSSDNPGAQIEPQPRTTATAPPPPTFDLTGYTSIDPSILTISPAPNSNLTVNVPVTITASATGKTLTELLLFQAVSDPADVFLYPATQAPFTIAYTPIRLGTANFVIFALFSDMTYTTTTLTYTLQSNGYAGSIELSDAPAYPVLVGTTFVVHTLAAFTGEQALDVTDQSTYTMAGGASSMFNVGANNVITALAPGSDTLNVSFGSRTASAKLSSYCTYALAPTNQIVAYGGGNVQIQVTTQPGCPWTASIGSTSFSEYPNQTGSGTGAIALTVSANPVFNNQSITVTVANQTATVTQPYAACTYTASVSQINAPPSGASGTINVNTQGACPLSAGSSASWASVSLNGSSVTYTVQPNLTDSSRSTTLLLGTQSIPINQASLIAGGGPVIAGVLNGASYQNQIASGAWLSIFGTNLATSAGLWQSSDFSGTNLPLSVGGVEVNINGLSAYVEYVSPTQLNVLAPGDVTTGPVYVQVINSLGASDTFTVNKQAYAPAFFAYEEQSGRYAIAEQGGTYALIGPAGLFGAGISLQQASPGESIILYATGLGQTNPAYPEGALVESAAQLATTTLVQLGGLPATVQFAGIIGAGLYQINLVVPNLPPGDAALTLSIGGVQAPQVYIPIGAGTQ